MLSEIATENMISKRIDEPVLDEKSTEASNTVSNSRNNKYSNKKNVIEDNYEMLKDNQDLTKGQLEESLFLHQEETESGNESIPNKELCLISEEPQLNVNQKLFQNL